MPDFGDRFFHLQIELDSDYAFATFFMVDATYKQRLICRYNDKEGIPLVS